ncbi:twin-arginine translocation signal domain-containing protein [Skermanella mucosa]|uniref:twin-arginine translocation signal domain-containing protein n=1 Tax=Skermanella mucosa TaxID=1789672 RepID=UPI00192B2B2A|nr:twin-arginine translocation signal domain-containing protein [Skermanella mucosa]UEM18814.1 twin-arginine translocation signal domain-containing protein [Skermanella mucosa]
MSSEKNIGVERKGGVGGSPVERRDFLKVIGLAGTAAAAAIPLAATSAAAEESPEERVKPRYQETAHVQQFYALNRL